MMTNVSLEEEWVSEAFVRKVAKKYAWVKGESRKVKLSLREALQRSI